MKYFFLVIDYLIPILLIISYPYWKKIANGPINNACGIRTKNSMKNHENWKRINMLCGKISMILGVVLFIFVSVVLYFNILPMEWNALMLTVICSCSFVFMCIYIDNKFDK
ncbi:SdpI family protein [uncultured Sneathia sp.]|uniref:SdpI family protein n=1 Tax=uncultured Sneathia sp. TaxID=278067 RepID=UPI00259BF0C9|nr:SdpI family protein [uncultured Sneathia sp.]